MTSFIFSVFAKASKLFFYAFSNNLEACFENKLLYELEF